MSIKFPLYRDDAFIIEEEGADNIQNANVYRKYYIYSIKFGLNR